MPCGELFSSDALLWFVYPNCRVKTGMRSRRLFSPHFSFFKSLSTAAELTWSLAGEFKSQLDAPWKPKEEKKNSLEDCALKNNKINKKIIKFRSPGSSSSLFAEPCVRASVRMCPPTLLFLLCSLICVRVLTQLKRLVPQSSAGYREERKEREEVWRLHQPAVRREEEEEEEEGLQKAWGLKVGGGAGFGDLNGRYAQPIMGVGMHLGFWSPSRIETLFKVFTSAGEGEFSVN